MSMSEIILCPNCRRRLQVPAEFQAEMVRCISCEATFPLASALPVPPPALAAPPGEPAPASPATAAPAPDRKEVIAGDVYPGTGIGRRPARTPCLVAALVAGAVLLMLGVGVVTLLVAVRAPRTAPMSFAVRIEEDEGERREQLREAFKDRKPLAADEITREVRPLFDALGAALRGQDADRIAAQFDAERMVNEVAAAGGGLPVRTARERRQFSTGLRQGIGKSLAERGPVFQWDATEVRNVKKLNNDEAVVIARHQQANHGTMKMRWWVTRRNGGWRVYDFEDLDTASRASSEITSLLGHAPGRAMEVARAVKTVGEAIQAVVQDDVDGAEKKLAQVQGVQLPPRFESIRRLAHGMVLLHRGKFEEALKVLEEAHRLQPDLPLADLLRGVALNRLGKPDQALEHLRAYRDLLGEDADVCRVVGAALRAQRRFPEAARKYRKALDFNPKEADAFLGLLRSLGADDNKDDLGPRFARLDSLRENFDVFAEECEEPWCLTRIAR
jgi:tetratricopeptide (TPR) repeat protein